MTLSADGGLLVCWPPARTDRSGPGRLRARGRPGAVGLRPRRADRPAGPVARRQDACLQRRGPQGEALGSPLSQAAAPPCPPQADWAQGLAFSSDGRRLAVGRFDGTIELVEAGTGKRIVALQVPAHPQPATQVLPSGPQRHARSAQPTGGVRAPKVRLTLSGQGVGQTTALVFREPGLSAAIVPATESRCQSRAGRSGHRA